MKNIRLIFLLVLCCSITGVSHALTLCAKTNTYVGMVRKIPDGVDSTYDNTAKIWKVGFDYTVPTKAHPEGENKVVTGLAACNEIEGTENTAKTNLYTSAVDAGTRCWCKMEPVLAYGYETGLTSYWVYLKVFEDMATCASTCTWACMDAMKNNVQFRSGVYESIW